MVTDLPGLMRAASEARISWRPAPTPHAALSPLQARSRLGAVPPGGAPALGVREQVARAALASESSPDGPARLAVAAPPSAFDWRDVSGANYISPVRDQAGCGSCVAFGTTAVLESMVRITARQPALEVDLSEAYAFFCLGPRAGAGACPGGGWWPDDALAAMKAGVTDEANFPYTDADQPCGRGADWKSRLTTFSSWTRKTSITAMKTYLSTVGPMTACFTVYEDFFSYYSGGVYSHSGNSGDVIGGHCVQVVGYDDAARCWIAKNSWGAAWGEDGYFRIRYGSAGFDAEMWGIDGTIRSPLIRTSLQVVAAGSGQVWHTRRSGAGAWQQAVDRLDTGTPGDPGAFTAVSAAATLNRLHVVGLVSGTAWYTRRRTGAGWAKWERPASTGTKPAKRWEAVSCAAVGDTLHVAALAGGAVWHTRRKADGSWQKTWVRATPVGAPGPFSALACVAVGGRATVVAVADGRLWLASRKRDGSWTTPAAIVAAGAATGPFTGVAAACVEGRLNLVALRSGRPWHVERSTTGSWGTWRELSTDGVPGGFDAVSCADVGATLHVLGLAGGGLWHSLRKADGTWQAGFTDVSARLSGEPARLDSVDGA